MEHRSRLRDANRADEPLLEAMTVEAVYLPDGSDPVSRSLLDDPRLRRYFEGFGAQPDDVGVVATCEGVDAGACWARCFSSDAPGYGWVAADVPELSIAIADPWRGRGLGTLMLRTLLDRLAVRGCRQVSLSVDPASPARRLYERLDFLHLGWEGTSMTMIRQLGTAAR